MLRGMSFRLRSPWWVATIGWVLTSSACASVSSDACETLMTMPSRFISRTTARPWSVRPCQRAGAQQESAYSFPQL